jgi:hypothetical protein
MVNWPPVRVIVWPWRAEENWIVSPLFAVAIAARSDPNPLS